MLEHSQYWLDRATRWAHEADDRAMLRWILYRRSHHAAAERHRAEAIGLAEAALRDARRLSSLMKAALVQQKAQGHALDRDERRCHRFLDVAHELVATIDDKGDARDGHGSFCTPGYLEMQRARCWLMLSRPDRAIGAFETALPELPAAYRRDRALANAGLAAAYAAINEPGQAAATALEALDIAESTGSTRIMNLVNKIGRDLARRTALPEVATLLNRLTDADHR